MEIATVSINKEKHKHQVEMEKINAPYVADATLKLICMYYKVICVCVVINSETPQFCRERSNAQISKYI